MRFPVGYDTDVELEDSALILRVMVYYENHATSDAGYSDTFQAVTTMNDMF